MTTDTTLVNDGALPTSDFNFSDTIANFWGGLKPIVQQGIQTWGSVEIAQSQANAQAKLNALKTQNATLGPNQPQAAQKVADQTLAQQWLPNLGGGGGSIMKWVVLAVVLAGAFWLVRKLVRQ